MSTTITVVGGGIGGLAAAITAAEQGAPVRLVEAHQTLGGRGRAADGDHLAHEGVHVFYADGPHYRWLRERGLVAGLGWPGPRAAMQLRYRYDNRLHRAPSLAVLRAMKARWRQAPVDVDFHSWASEVWGERTARQAASAIAVATYHHDNGELSAAFVWDLFQRVFGFRVPGIRWVRGSWQTVIDRMIAAAEDRGVSIETSTRVNELPSDGPVIVATDLHAARSLLDDSALSWSSGHAELLDLAVRHEDGDASLVFDLDQGSFAESCSMTDPAAAPPGENLYGLQAAVRPGESTAEARARLDRLADQALPGWRDRSTFVRRAAARGRTGALDLPGQTWRDRPAIDRGDGIYLVGDQVAAPGMRGEISINSGVAAALAATSTRSVAASLS